MTQYYSCTKLSHQPPAHGQHRLVAHVFSIWLMALLIYVSFTGLSQWLEKVYAYPSRAATLQDTPDSDAGPLAPAADIEPSLASVQLDLSAIITDNIILYTVYATNVTEQSVWDLNVKIPLPPGTLLLSAEATSPFTVDYQDAAVSFYIAELRPNSGSGPQRVRVATVEADDVFISTHAEATWKYMDTILRQSMPFQAQTRSSALSMYVGTTQQILTDMEGEVPLAHIDFTGITIQQEGSILRIDYLLAGLLGSTTGERTEYILYIDSDCNTATGRTRDGLGSEFRLRYRHDRGQADMSTWTQAADGSGQWLLSGSIAVTSPAGAQTITLWVPTVMLNNSYRFCWMAESQHRTDTDAPRVPGDKLPNGIVDLTFTQFGNWDAAQIFPSTLLTTPITSLSNDLLTSESTIWSLPAAAPTTLAQLSGKLAIPLANPQGSYDVHIFSVPDGQLLQQIPNAHQPTFRSDGTQLLMTRSADNAVNVYEFTLEDGTDVPSGALANSSFPSYNLLGTHMVFEEWRPASDGTPAMSTTGDMTHTIALLQCELRAMDAADGATCQNPVALKTLVATDVLGEIYGTNPLWTATDKIIYRGCQGWNGLDMCGIYTIPTAATNSELAFPTLLTRHPNSFPEDSKRGFVTITSRHEADWEVYALSLDGSWLVNISQNQTAQDGLSAISPDGDWVAFVSNREGGWAVWVAPLTGGVAYKLFDLPDGSLWASNEDEWVRQRLSWGR